MASCQECALYNPERQLCTQPDPLDQIGNPLGPDELSKNPTDPCTVYVAEPIQLRALGGIISSGEKYIPAFREK